MAPSPSHSEQSPDRCGDIATTGCRLSTFPKTSEHRIGIETEPTFNLETHNEIASVGLTHLTERCEDDLPAVRRQEPKSIGTAGETIEYKMLVSTTHQRWYEPLTPQIDCPSPRTCEHKRHVPVYDPRLGGGQCWWRATESEPTPEVPESGQRHSVETKPSQRPCAPAVQRLKPDHVDVHESYPLGYSGNKEVEEQTLYSVNGPPRGGG